jgi:hypothetical protein
MSITGASLHHRPKTGSPLAIVVYGPLLSPTGPSFSPIIVVTADRGCGCQCAGRVAPASRGAARIGIDHEADFIEVLGDQTLRFSNLLQVEAEIRGQLGDRIDPELRFPVGMLNMNARPPFFAGALHVAATLPNWHDEETSGATN